MTPRDKYLSVVPAVCIKRQFYRKIIGGAKNKQAKKIQSAFHTVRYVIVTVELVQKMSVFVLNMGTVRVTVFAPTLNFTLLTACTIVVQSWHMIV